MAAADIQRARYEEWVGLYAPELYRFAHRMTGRHQLAEDLVQETFTEAWRSMVSQREPSKARAWLYQILRHRHLRHLRASRQTERLVRLPDTPDEHPASPARDPLDAMADREALQLGLDALPTELRLTLEMVVAEQFTCRETAATLGIPLGTVLSRLDRARRKLHALVEGTRPTDPAVNSTHPPTPRAASDSNPDPVTGNCS